MRKLFQQRIFNDLKNNKLHYHSLQYLKDNIEDIGSQAPLEMMSLNRSIIPQELYINETGYIYNDDYIIDFNKLNKEAVENGETCDFLSNVLELVNEYRQHSYSSSDRLDYIDEQKKFYILIVMEAYNIVYNTYFKELILNCDTQEELSKRLKSLKFK